MTPRRWMRVPIFSSKAKSYYVVYNALSEASYAMRSTLPIKFSDVPLVPPSDGTRRRNEHLSHLILNSHDWRGCSWRRHSSSRPNPSLDDQKFSVDSSFQRLLRLLFSRMIMDSGQNLP